MSDPLEIFFSYAPEDEVWQKRIETHLSVLKRQRLIKGWHARQTLAGSEWTTEQNEHLKNAPIILLLISPAFIESDECWDIHLQQAIERHNKGEARVIPISVRPIADWDETPFAHLQALPKDGKALSSASNIDQALATIAQEIRRVIPELQKTQEQKRTTTPSTASSSRQGAPVQPPPIDVLLATATEMESRAVLDLFPEVELHHIEDQSYYDLGQIKGARVFLVQSEMGTGGPSGSTLTLEEAVRLLHPTAIIAVGIAFGVSEEKQSIGDILISQQLVPYDLQRVGTNKRQQYKIILRGDRPSASTRMLQRFRAATTLRKEATPRINFGPILSGDKLVDNQDFRDQLVRLAEEAIGGEMEGAGLYAVAQRKKVDWILVKAICDWADGNKGTDKEQRQWLAAQQATQFVHAVLQLGGFSKQPSLSP